MDFLQLCLGCFVLHKVCLHKCSQRTCVRCCSQGKTEFKFLCASEPAVEVWPGAQTSAGMSFSGPALLSSLWEHRKACAVCMYVVKSLIQRETSRPVRISVSPNRYLWVCGILSLFTCCIDWGHNPCGMIDYTAYIARVFCTTKLRKDRTWEPAKVWSGKEEIGDHTKNGLSVSVFICIDCNLYCSWHG